MAFFLDEKVRNEFRQIGDKAGFASEADGAGLARPEHAGLVAASLGIGGQLGPLLVELGLLREVAGDFTSCKSVRLNFDHILALAAEEWLADVVAG